MKRVIVMLGLLAGLGSADLSSGLDITQLYRESDSVFVGRVSGIHRFPDRVPSVVGLWQFDFASLRIYKGFAIALGHHS